MLDLEPIKARMEAATPGPWIWYGTTFSERDILVCKKNYEPITLEPWSPDGVFLVSARTDIPTLVAEVEELREKLTETANIIRKYIRGEYKAVKKAMREYGFDFDLPETEL